MDPGIWAGSRGDGASGNPRETGEGGCSSGSEVGAAAAFLGCHQAAAEQARISGNPPKLSWQTILVRMLKMKCQPHKIGSSKLCSAEVYTI